MTQAHYTYKEALEIVEEFMIESGIRRYCETICKGGCCDEIWDEKQDRYVPCWESKYACWRNEGRRLPCSIYLCPALLEILPDADLLANLKTDIVNSLWDIIHNNPYFTPNTKEIQAKFYISKSKLDTIKTLKLRKYRRIMRYLIRNRVQVSKAPYRRLKLISHFIRRNRR